MAKFAVIDTRDNARRPFLRGILTSSLQSAGLSFKQAYELASKIRDNLDDNDDVSREQLRKEVLKQLQKHYPQEVLDRYLAKGRPPQPIMVDYGDGLLRAFSRGVHQQRLASCCMPRKKAVQITHLIHDYLYRSGKRAISSKQISRLTYQYLRQEAGDELADQYLVWSEFLRSERPLLLLMGGIPGSGKSTLSTEIAGRLDIIRIQSTDMLREVMRILIPKRLSPVLHTSSFLAGKAVDTSIGETTDTEQQVLEGFRRQTEKVELACEAILQRAINERVSLILEGVHIRPTLLDHLPESDAVVVPVMLGVERKSDLEKRITGRSKQSKQRRAERYLDNIDALWHIQTMLFMEADAANVPILINTDRDIAVQQIIGVVMGTLENEYKDQMESLRPKIA
ncbi:MAG: zeta toxin family protein [Pseudomonadota bacterium]|nr:zeta toxin family protein [Pseudomonadota bacterium]